MIEAALVSQINGLPLDGVGGILALEVAP